MGTNRSARDGRRAEKVIRAIPATPVELTPFEQSLEKDGEPALDVADGVRVIRAMVCSALKAGSVTRAAAPQRLRARNCARRD